MYFIVESICFALLFVCNYLGIAGIKSQVCLFINLNLGLRPMLGPVSSCSLAGCVHGRHHQLLHRCLHVSISVSVEAWGASVHVVCLQVPADHLLSRQHLL